MKKKPSLKKNIILLIVYIIFFISLVTSPVSAQVQDWEVVDPTTGVVDKSKSCTVDGVPTLACLEVVYGNVLYLSSSLVLIVLFIMLMYGGFTYMTSLGNATKITKGSSILKWALIGLGLYIASYVILFIIDVAFLGGKGEIFRLNIPGPND